MYMMSLQPSSRCGGDVIRCLHIWKCEDHRQPPSFTLEASRGSAKSTLTPQGLTRMGERLICEGLHQSSARGWHHYVFFSLESGEVIVKPPQDTFASTSRGSQMGMASVRGSLQGAFLRTWLSFYHSHELVPGSRL